jgi:hypothetical protein
MVAAFRLAGVDGSEGATRGAVGRQRSASGRDAECVSSQLSAHAVEDHLGPARGILPGTGAAG